MESLPALNFDPNPIASQSIEPSATAVALTILLYFVLLSIAAFFAKSVKPTENDED